MRRAHPWQYRYTSRDGRAEIALFGKRDIVSELCYNGILRVCSALRAVYMTYLTPLMEGCPWNSE